MSFIVFHWVLRKSKHPYPSRNGFGAGHGRVTSILSKINGKTSWESMSILCRHTQTHRSRVRAVATLHRDLFGSIDAAQRVAAKREATLI